MTHDTDHEWPKVDLTPLPGINRYPPREPGGTDHGPWDGIEVSPEITCESEGHYAAELLAQDRAADRARWRKVDWHPVLTYSAVMVASGWLAGAWYAWVIDDNGAQLAICLIGFASTLFPGIPWQELVTMAKSPSDPKRVNP